MNRQRTEQAGVSQAGVQNLQISDLTADARGVGHNHGMAVFVAGALPGEAIQYKHLRQHKRYEEGELQDILQPSPARVSPRCPHFGACGGCVLQHFSGPGQIEFKQAQLLNTLQRIGKVVPQRVLPPVTGPLWQYRRRARLSVKYNPATGNVAVGFRERSGAGIADLQGCDVLIAEAGGRLTELQHLIGQLSIKNRLPQIEVAGGDNGVALVLRVLASPSEGDRVKLEQFSRDTGLWIYLQPGGQQSVTPLRENTPELVYKLPAYNLEIGFAPTDFIQINALVNQKLIDQAVALLALEPEDHALDLFSGVGNFSLPMARHAGRVTSVEGDKGLVSRAIANAARNGLDNCFSIRQDLFARKSPASWENKEFNKVLIDPPRSGARGVLPLLAAKRPSHILYCSCHPATLARDAQSLVHKHGYTLAAAGVIDMFPHTAHTEAMALFERS